jgi:hypothetical protein
VFVEIFCGKGNTFLCNIQTNHIRKNKKILFYAHLIADESPSSFTIHGGIIDFKGKSYLFYHDSIRSGGNGFRRTTAIHEFQRQKDGRIPKINIQAK